MPVRIPHVTLALTLALSACGSSSDGKEKEQPVPLPAGFDPNAKYEVGITGADLSPTITHALFPARVGASWTYEGDTDEGKERIEITVGADQKDVWGAKATIVRDTVYRDDEMIEDTWDWFAEDGDGNVWYLGEETYEYENGKKVCDCGAWEAGVEGALPGIVMLANPKVGDAYRQEYFAGEAEDLGEVVALDVSVTVPAGSFEGCLRTRDLSTLDRTAEEFKTYCPGVGVVLEEAGDERVELVEYSGL